MASPRCSSRRPSSSLPWIVYPTIRTIIRSFYDREGDTFVGVDNYETLFTDDTLLIAIRNNFLWILVVPALVTAIGLVFAVLLERIRFLDGVQGRGLYADGDLALRRRRDLAADVREATSTR